MNNKAIRWKQRFQNYERAYLLLEKYLKIETSSEVERAGIIQFFEMAFELSWKLMKDYLEDQGFIVTSPKEAIKQAFQSDVITNGHHWMDALEDRNLTTHTYNEETANAIENKIREIYFPELKNFYLTMKENMEK